MIKVVIGSTTFFCETPEEAVRVHRLSNSQGGTIVHASAKAAIKRPLRPATSAVLKKLGQNAGKDLSSDDMAKVMGAASANGLGPKIAQLRRELENDGQTIEDYIVKQKPDPMGPTTWRIVQRATA
jgi:hypothetical protein